MCPASRSGLAYSDAIADRSRDENESGVNLMSLTSGWPAARVTRMFSGERFACTTPASWAASSPPAAWKKRSTASAAGNTPRAARMSDRGSPVRYSSTTYPGPFGSSPISWTAATFTWRILSAWWNRGSWWSGRREAGKKSRPMPGTRRATSRPPGSTPRYSGPSRVEPRFSRTLMPLGRVRPVQAGCSMQTESGSCSVPQ